MPDDKIDIGIPINVTNLLETRMMIQAGSGGGKSQTVRKIIECVAASTKLQQIVLDPEGEYETIREKFDFALVAVHGGDIPLQVKYAETLARKIMELGISVIIDLYELPVQERIVFVKRFCRALIHSIAKELWHPVLVYIDEAQKFCPEKGHAESAEAVIELCTLGRKRGIAAILATQRISQLDKNAAAECLNKLIGRTGLDIDRTRAGDELGFSTKEDRLLLRNLEPGEFYCFGPAISVDVKKIKVKPVTTSHRRPGVQNRTPPPTPTAIKRIISKLSDIPEEAEKELKTKKDYEEKIKTLQATLKKASVPTPDQKKQATDTKQTGELQQKLVQANAKIAEYRQMLNSESARFSAHIKLQRRSLAEYKKLLDTLIFNTSKLLGDFVERTTKPLLTGLEDLAGKANLLLENANKFTQNVDNVSPEAGKFPETAKNYSAKPANNIPAASTKPLPAPRPARQTEPGAPSNGKIPKGELIILIACAQSTGGASRQKLTVLSGYKRRTRDAYLQGLALKGYVEATGGLIMATQEGIDALGDNFEPLPTGLDLQQHWLENLPRGECAILQVLIEDYPDQVSRDAITERTGYTRRTRDAYLQQMTAKEIIIVTGQGMVKASETLFE